VVNSTDPQCSGGVTIRNTPLVTVTSEGLVGKVRRQVESTLFPTGTPATVNCLPTETFQMALHASGTITMNGHYTIDSYNSSHGAYAQTTGSSAKVSMDSVANGAISTGSQGSIMGDAAVGPGGNPSQGISGDGVTGAKTTETDVVPMPMASIPTNLRNLGSMPDGVSLSAGLYWYSSASIQHAVTINGAVTIYVTGSFSVSGNGVLNKDGLPSNLTIIGTGDPANPQNVCTSVSIKGNGDFVGAIYAPQAAIALGGNGAMYGAAMGASITLGGGGNSGALHYDLALQQGGTAYTATPGSPLQTTGYTAVTWREIPF
jgi:hypothetical protein